MAAAAAPRRSGTGLLSIGQVLETLQGEFSDLSPSKLRFLEEQGLVTPQRTQAGYRKFDQSHVERIRIILTLQRNFYLPLRVISSVLSELDAGRDPVIPGAVPRNVSSILRPRSVLSRDELLRQTGASPRFLGEAISAGLLPPSEVFSHDALAQLTSLLQLSERGLTPRHLRQLRLAAERDVALIEQAVATRGISAGGEAKAGNDSLELAELLDTVRSGIIKHRLAG